MARTPRLIIPNLPHHILQVGHDRHEIFRDQEDYTVFLRWLREASQAFNVAVHAFVLLPDQWQLLATPADEQGLGRMLQWLGRYYVPYFNRKYDRSGTLWQGRFKAAVIEPKGYFMRCCRYIDTSPVRAGLVSRPADYAWSSYTHHVGERQNALISGHALYWSLGNTPFDRELAYKKLVAQGLTASDVSLIGKAIARGRALGSEQFQLELEKQTGRKVREGKRGRPRRVASLG